MTHPTDDELEAMAARLEASAYVRSPAHEIEAAAMLRACKGITAALEARAEKAEAERDVLRDREKHFASVLSVADRGQYRNDWDAAIRRVVAERDALREALVKADELAGAIENDVWQNTQTWFALTAYREARDALNRETGT